MQFREEFGPVDGLPTRLFFTGPEIGEEFQVAIEPGKVLNMKVLAISDLHPNGHREVFCEMNGQLRTVMVEDKSVTKVRIELACEQLACARLSARGEHRMSGGAKNGEDLGRRKGERACNTSFRPLVKGKSVFV